MPIHAWEQGDEVWGQQRISTIAATAMEVAVKSSGQRFMMAVDMRCENRGFRRDASRVESAALVFGAEIIMVFPTINRSHRPKTKNKVKLEINNNNNIKISDFGLSSSFCTEVAVHIANRTPRETGNMYGHRA